MSSFNPTTVLSDCDVNTDVSSSNSATITTADFAKPVAGSNNTLDYHRQLLQSKLSAEEGKTQYVSPSDNIMSPCTAKLSAYKNKHFMKAKPQSLFAKSQTSKLSPQGFTGFESVANNGKQESSSPESGASQ